MVSKKFLKDIYKASSSLDEAEKMLVVAFICKNDLQISKGSFLYKYLPCQQLKKYESILPKCQDVQLSIEELIEYFELLNYAGTKKEKGVVYTPAEVREVIVNKLIDCKHKRILDPACGCAAFLVTAAECLHERFKLSYREIIAEYLYGIDIDGAAINRAKIVLSLMALVNGEPQVCSFNLMTADSLDVATSLKIARKYGKFDCVIGNPPYVRFRNIQDAEKQYFDTWISTKVGNVDLYMPFFEIGIKLLNDDGKLGYITPNSFLQGINARGLREYICSLQSKIEIFDFRDTQIFPGVTSYTCISIIHKGEKTSCLLYGRVYSVTEIYAGTLTEYDLSAMSGSAWRLQAEGTADIIYALENAGKKLGEWKIRNGLATLMNDLFIFSPMKEDGKYYYREYNHKKYKIEKDICINIAKPNIIHTEKELLEKMERAIFPYRRVAGSCEIISETDMQKDFPETYRFLKEYKNQLAGRDKGHGNYTEWYAYGRTQGLNNIGKKLLIPYMAGHPTAVLCKDEALLFYCGYAIICDDEKELLVLKRFLESDAFWFYICKTSKPYSKGYMALAKNYITSFSIPYLTNREKQALVKMSNSKQVNAWIWKKYGIEDIPVFDDGEMQ